MAALSFMRGEPLLSKLSALSTFVTFPAAIIAYCIFVPDKPPRVEIRRTESA